LISWHQSIRVVSLAVALSERHLGDCSVVGSSTFGRTIVFVSSAREDAHSSIPIFGGSRL
jgi:hypothetical protein